MTGCSFTYIGATAVAPGGTLYGRRKISVDDPGCRGGADFREWVFRSGGSGQTFHATRHPDRRSQPRQVGMRN